MIEQVNDGDGCKLFVTTYTLLDFPSLDQAKRLSFIKTMSGVMDWRNGGTRGFALVATRCSLNTTIDLNVSRQAQAANLLTGPSAFF